MTTETVTEETMSFIKLARTKDPVVVEQNLTRRITDAVDEELESLATHVLSSPDFDDVFQPEVLGPLHRGDGVSALKALSSRLRRRFAKLLRDSQYGEDETFYGQ